MNEKNIVEILLTVLTVINGEVKVLLIRKKDEPYKGYWQLPNIILSNDANIEETMINYLSEETGLPINTYKLSGVFSDINRKVDKRIIGINYSCYIDAVTVDLKQNTYLPEEVNWFSIDHLPKLAFDYELVLDKALSDLKDSILKIDTLKCFFPSDFSFPELQSACEMALQKQLDRRNFRKYFIKNDTVLATGDYTEGNSGRPAKLYRFKDEEETLDVM